MEDSKQSEALSLEQFNQIMDKLSRKVLIKAMFQAKERGLSAKVIDRKLIINNVIYKVSNIPEDLRPPQSSAQA